MRWHTHAAASANAAWFFMILPAGIVHPIFLVIAGALGGLLPDIDASDSKIQNMGVKGINPLKIPAMFFNLVFGHRGVLHSLLGTGILIVISLVLLIWVPWQILLAIWLGYLIHIALDMLNPYGVPLLYPLGRKFHLLPKILRIPTGTAFEELVFAIFAMSLVAYLFMSVFQ